MIRLTLFLALALLPLFCGGDINANKQILLVKFAAVSEYESALVDLASRYHGAACQRRGVSAVGGYPLYVLSIGDPAKPAIMLEAELHGRHEWKGTHLLLDYLRRLPELNPGLLDRYRIVVVPMANPYGYFSGAYHNGHAYSDGVNPRFAGVNLNRQFSYRWRECPLLAPGFWEKDLYKAFRTPDFYAGKGPAPFSEPETRLLRDLVLAEKPVAYISLHVMGVNPALIPSGENYNIVIWHGPSLRLDVLKMLKKNICPTVDARHRETSALGNVDGGPLPADYPESPQSYLWTQEVLGIPSFVLEAGDAYNDEYLIDLYDTVLQQDIERLAIDELH